MLKLVLRALVCYRLSQLVVYDEGPFQVFDRLRVWAGCYDYGKDGKPSKELGRLLSCPYCVGIWFAIPLALTSSWENIVDLLILWLAIAGLQSFMQSLSDGKDN